MGVKSCDSCKTTPADLFCRADSAFLCVACDGEVHAANKLASHHDRAWLSEAEAEAATWLNKTPHEEDDPKVATEYSNCWFNADGVVPVRNDNKEDHGYGVVDGLPAAYDMPPPPFLYHFTCQPAASSSAEIEASVVPEGEASNHQVYPSALSGPDREARVLRYKEKKKNRKFDKTIRYVSRKAYAETRPRIKGRFAKRSDDYGLVPSY